MEGNFKRAKQSIIALGIMQLILRMSKSKILQSGYKNCFHCFQFLPLKVWRTFVTVSIGKWSDNEEKKKATEEGTANDSFEIIKSSENNLLW